ncbi:MAG: biotin/lipoyl-containing protein, partial [Longimicrobiales bacterium]|nr:biotin/lipoyl-containing protein [Longimicrobiales bacterium]
MITKVHMEALSPTMEEGQLVQWLKSEGDEIANGDVLAEIETDKATMELVARGDGVLRKIFLQEGGTAEVGAVIGVIAGEDEDISDVEGTTGGGGASADGSSGGDEDDGKRDAEEGAADASDKDGAASAEKATPKAAASGQARAESQDDGGDDGRVKASPLARRLAEDAGLELSRISGSGPGGRVVKRDVEKAKEEGVSAPSRTAESWTPDESEYEDVPVSQMRKAIAKRLVQSIGPVPTFYLTIDVDMGRAIEA